MKIARALLKAPKTLITGGRGQLGRGIAKELAERNGYDNVILSDINNEPGVDNIQNLNINCVKKEEMHSVIKHNNIDHLIHLPALLSVTCEKFPDLAWDVNITAMRNAVLLAKEFNLRLFIPSTIGAFGKYSPLEDVPDICIQRVDTMYGFSKVAMENFGLYFKDKHGVDFRCLRYPGIISPVAEPGGGTTDYAVDIFKESFKDPTGHFECYLNPDSRLPMMLEDDCITSTCDFMEKDLDEIPLSIYNVQGTDFTPKEVHDEILKHYPDYTISYKSDPLRQGIADSWPKKFNDSGARGWGFKPEFDNVEKITKHMYKCIAEASK